MGYNDTYSTTHHPQSNTMIERFNATFIPQIAKLQDRENNNWDEFLAPVVFAHNTGCHSTTFIRWRTKMTNRSIKIIIMNN